MLARLLRFLQERPRMSPLLRGWAGLPRHAERLREVTAQACFSTGCYWTGRREKMIMCWRRRTALVLRAGAGWGG